MCSLPGIIIEYREYFDENGDDFGYVRYIINQGRERVVFFPEHRRLQRPICKMSGHEQMMWDLYEECCDQ